MNNTRTTKECIDRIEVKIDRILQDLTAIHEALAQNEAEHNAYERRLVELAERRSANAQALAWFTGILGAMLTLINVLNGIL